MIKKLHILIRLFFSKQNQNTPTNITTELFGNTAKCLCFVLFLWVNFSFGQSSQTFTTSGTFAVPAGVTSVTVQAWGGGGAGGGANNANATRNGGGGGGGAYTIRTVTVTPLSSIVVTVGSGGLGITASDNGTNTGNGNDGGASTFASTVAVIAAGGKGGKVGNSANDNGIGGAGGSGGTFNGGNGQDASGTAGGGGGGSAGTAANGNTGTLTGVTAVVGGGGGAPGRNNTGLGISATTLGAGGGGGRMSNSADVKGGDGFRGQLIVTWCNPFSLTGANTATGACTSVGTSTVTLASNTTALPAGTYTVTYDTNFPSQTGLTASMNVTGGTGTFTATGLTNAGSRTITITQLTSNSCSSTISSNNTANVIVTGAPSTSNAGPDQSTGGGSFTLAANAPTVGAGVWSIANGPSTLLSQFSSTSSPTATFTPAVSGTYVLNWAISNSCGSFNDQVVVANNCVANLISNSDFSGNTTGWTFATTYGNRIEVNPENTYFSNGNSDFTAELDSEASLRQVMTVIPGVSYTVSFRYARRPNSGTPATTGVTVKITGGATDFISTDFTTTSTTAKIGTFIFTPTSSSIGVEFYNTIHGGKTLGTIIDDIVLVPTSQVTPAAITSPRGEYNTLSSCAGVAIQLDVENVPASGITYAWVGSAGTVFSATNIKNPMVTFAGSGVQQVSVTTTTAAGCSGSSITYVNVTAAPTITAPTASSVCSGGTYTSGVITSTGTIFDWSRAGVTNINGGAAGAGGTSIANATGFTEVLTNSTASPINVTYVLTPKPPSSGCAGIPYNLVVTVNPTVGITITAPTASPICSGSTYSSGAITSTGTTFDWSRAAVPNINGNAAGAGGTNIAKATGFSEVLTNSTSSAIAVTYVLTPKSALGCSGTPYNLVVTVNPTAGITISAPTAGSVCSGSTYSSGAITSTGTIFDWSRAAVTNINGNAAGAGGTNIAKATGFSEVLTNSTSSAIAVTYVLTPKSASGCSGTPYNLVVTVNPTAGITISAPTASPICSGGTYSSGAITSTGTTFDWSRAAVTNINANASGIGGTGIVNATGFSEVLTNSTSSAIAVTYVLTPKSALGCSGTPYNLVVTVNPTAGITISAPTAGSVCSGSTYSSGAISSTGTTFDWSRAAVPNINANAAGAGGTNIAKATGFSEVLTNSTSSAIAVTYVLTPKSASGCSGTPYNLVVTVNPTAGITISAPTASPICSGSTYTSGAITSTGTIFDWSRAAVPNINGNAAGAGGTNIAKATGFSEVLTNSTSSAIAVTYVLTPKSASGCSGTPYNLVVTVNPTAGITISVPTASSVCSGGTYTSGAIASTGTTFDWSRAAVPNINGNASGVGGTGIVNATGFSEVLTNSTSSAIAVTYVLTPKSGSGCSGTPYNLVVTVNPTPTPKVGTTTHISCTANTGSVVLENLPSGNWTINQTGDATASYSNTIANTTSTTVSGLAAGTYTFIVTNSSGCPSSPNTVSILDNSNIWNGTVWSKGVQPNASMNVIIASVTPGSPFTVDLVACALTINSGVVATVPSGITLTITNEVSVYGKLTFENNASLVQINTVNNNFGPINYKRNSQPMKNFDYTYWSSPVEGQTFYNLSPNTLWDKYLSFTGAVWQEELGTSVMKPGIGYIIRVPKPNSVYLNGKDYWTGSSYIQQVEFIGRPNNGNISSSQYMEKNKYYLIGNPYPSAIHADDFLKDPHNDAILGGTVYFWTHNTAIKVVNSKLAYVSDDYASYNITGGVASAPSDPQHSSGTPSSDQGKKPTGFIAAGQSFFTSAEQGSGYVQFTNAMRYGGTKNAQFFKPGKTSKSAVMEKHRLWLNMTNSGGAFKQTLIGYIEGATNTYDKIFDGLSFDGNSYIDFYSVNATTNLTIQGRALPFTDSDMVPLGYRSTLAGDFTIAIDEADGNLATQRVYLEDKQTGTIKELTAGNYTFTTKAGTFNNRFVLRYTDKTLGTGDFETTENAVSVVIQNKIVTINSTIENIDKMFIYDLSGKQLFKKDNVKNLQLVIQNLPFAQQVLLVKVVLENGYQTTKKVIFK